MTDAREDFGQLGSDQLTKMPETNIQVVAAHRILKPDHVMVWSSSSYVGGIIRIVIDWLITR
jgi:hypothetical protein